MKRTKITQYEVVTWTNTETRHKLYGVRVFVVGTGWAFLETDRTPILKYNRISAEAVITDMKAQRTRSGYKRRKVATS